MVLKPVGPDSMDGIYRGTAFAEPGELALEDELYVSSERLAFAVDHTRDLQCSEHLAFADPEPVHDGDIQDGEVRRRVTVGHTPGNRSTDGPLHPVDDVQMSFPGRLSEGSRIAIARATG